MFCAQDHGIARGQTLRVAVDKEMCDVELFQH